MNLDMWVRIHAPEQPLLQFELLHGLKGEAETWVLEYTALTLFSVLGSHHSCLYLKSTYLFFSRVYSKVGLYSWKLDCGL